MRNTTTAPSLEGVLIPATTILVFQEHQIHHTNIKLEQAYTNPAQHSFASISKLEGELVALHKVLLSAKHCASHHQGALTMSMNQEKEQKK
jgi:hypothetical protein